jgi:hypothetical protein
MGPTLAEIDRENQIIHIKDQADYQEGESCATVMVSYKKTLDLGILPAGDYQVKFLQSEKKDDVTKRGILSVDTASSPMQDDHLYARTEFLHASKCSQNIDRYNLIHVRTLNGGSLNKMIEIE